MEKIILLAISLILAASTAGADRLTIGPAHALPDYTKLVAASDTPSRPFIVAFAPADFNEDGRLDLVVQTGNLLSPNLTPFGAKVFLQDAGGNFQETNEYLLPTAGITWEFVPGDFNEDGHLDILMEEADHDMLLLPGNGDGTFGEPAFLGLSAAGYFAVGDVNGDSHLDIVAGKLAGGVGVFAGLGNGTFNLSATLTTQVSPSYPRRGVVSLGDINKDGRADVIVTARPDGPLIGILDVFFGNSDGTFEEAVRTPGVAARQAALGDFNGDGNLDYAGSGGAPEQLQIWLGQTNGHFSKDSVHLLSAMFIYADDVTVADVNYDGILDVLVSGETSSTIYTGPVAIFLGKGDGTFQPKVDFTQANNTWTLNAGPQVLDFNRDGWLDIVSLCWTSHQRGREALMIALSRGVNRDPKFGFRINIERPEGSRPAAVVLETSSDLVTWSGLATNVSSVRNWPVMDAASDLNYRFYRTARPDL